MIFVPKYKEELKQYVLKNKELLNKLGNQKILITGAAGLIGSYIMDLIIVASEILDISCKIYAIDKNKELLDTRFPDRYDKIIKKLYADVNCESLETDDVDFVIHAASNTSPLDYALKPVETMRTNMIGTDKMIRLSLEKKAKRFIFCSSVEAYGRNNGDIDEFTEDYSGYVDCNTLRAGYPSAKRASEALLNAYKAENKEFDFVIARIGRIYGPTVINGDTKAPTQFIYNAVNGNDIVIKSNGMQEYSYGYVGDCATAIIKIMIDGANGEAYNIADPKSKVLLKDFAQYAAECVGTNVVFETPNVVEMQGYSKITKATMNMDKLISLGWQAECHIKDGIDRTVKYLKKIKENQ